MKTIHFKEIKDNGVNMVFTGLLVDNEKSTLKQMNAYMTEKGVFRNGVKAIELMKIDGNVLGDEGRSDILVLFNKRIDISEPGNYNINPFKRILHSPDLKWTCDFLDNYKRDYKAI